MKKNKIVISIFAAVSAISIMVGYSLLKQNNSNKNNQLAIMLKQEDGTYIRSNISAFENDEYKFDHAVCNNGTTVTANSNKGVNLKLLGADKCIVYLKSKTVIDKIKASAEESTNSMYQTIEPSNAIKSVADNNFNKGKQTFPVDTIHQNYYMTYADSYIFNTPTMAASGTNYPTYTLTEPQIGKYSEIYNNLVGKYVVNYEGHNLSTAAYSGDLTVSPKTGLDIIYKIVSATATSITYIPSSYTIEFTNSTTGVYTAEDDNNTISYYYRGNVTNNYVKFGKWTNEVYRGYNSNQTAYKEYFTPEDCAKDVTYKYDCNRSPVAGKDMYWRIVRINGEGSLKLMYDGTEAHANGTSSLDRIALPYQKFNTSYNNNAYVGYMYGDINGTTYAEVHANTNPSEIKTALENWYEKNFVGTQYESKIGNMSFCNDRSIAASPLDGTIGTGIEAVETYYGARGRLQTNKSPSLVCPQKANDLFTNNTDNGGNGKLKYPVGLLTADETALAGGVYGPFNRGCYLNKRLAYWLGSASSNGGGFVIGESGNVGSRRVDFTYGVVPVINLTQEYANQLKGLGTMEDPYTLG